jgi:hypothetical protein
MNSTKWLSKLVAPLGFPVSENYFLERKKSLLNEAADFPWRADWIKQQLGVGLLEAPEEVVDEFVISGLLPQRSDMFCARCKYFEPWPSGVTGGECRRGAPIKGGAPWPFVTRGQWCGRFEEMEPR